MNIKILSHIGDILAIPFFYLLVIYFYKKKKRTLIENLLYLFSINGFILDTLFTIDFLKKYK